MATPSSTARDTPAPRDHMHPARAFCLLVGPLLILVGALGFAGDSAFTTGDRVEGGTFLGLEVNGWHNVVHIVTGLLLLLGTRSWRGARAVCLLFAGGYALVTLIGFIDGSDVVGLFPVNAADNFLHLALALIATVAAFAPAPAGDNTLRRTNPRAPRPT